MKNASAGGGTGRLLLVDDDRAVLQSHERVLSRYSPRVAEDGIAAREVLGRSDIDVVVCDLEMPGMDGLALMEWAKETCPKPLWIVVSGQDTFDSAVQALRLGAFDFLCKPIVPVQLRKAVANAMRQQDLIAERASLARALADNNRELAQKLRELEAAHEVLRHQRAMLDQDLQRAERIMRALLPETVPSLETMQINVGYRPCNAIGGDLYGFTTIDDRHLAVYVADAAGHGVSAALLAVLFDQKVRTFDARNGSRAPAAVLTELNRGLFHECRASGLFVTAILAVVETMTGAVTLASAGHPPALLLRSGGTIERTTPGGPALGLDAEATFEEQRVTLGAGDRMFLYTDGLAGSLPPDDSGLDSMVKGRIVGAADGKAAIDDLLAMTARGRGAEDDVTLLLLTAGRGVSTVVDAARSAAPPPMPTECTLELGSAEDTTWIAVRGHAIWTQGPPLRDACRSALAAGRKTIVDLGACTMLDSTMLGTLHELVSTIDPPGSLSVQAVRPEIRDLFAELSMKAVLAHIVDRLPLPAVMTPLPARGDAGGHGHILRAHELLAELSAKNAEQFGPVIEALRMGE
jgi:phosphoserine phosphatase RsbU/P